MREARSWYTRARGLQGTRNDSDWLLERALIHLPVRHLSFSRSGKGVLRNSRQWDKDRKSNCDFYSKFKISCTLNLAYLCHPKLLFKFYFDHVAALVELVVTSLTSLSQGLANVNRTLRRNWCLPMTRRKQKHEQRLVYVINQGIRQKTFERGHLFMSGSCPGETKPCRTVGCSL